MKLYYKAGSCSLSPHIVLCEADFTFETEAVNLQTKVTDSGQDYNAIAEKGAVPLLVLDNGEKLSEGVAIVQYLADLKPETNLAPKNGTFERVRMQEWLNYIATEVHKTHGPLYNPKFGPAAAEIALERLKKAYNYISAQLEGKKFLMGDQFTVADAYLFTIIGWHTMIKLDLAQWPVLVEYQTRVAARPGVQAAMRAEGLLQDQAVAA